jgi:hypothetical protein
VVNGVLSRVFYFNTDGFFSCVLVFSCVCACVRTHTCFQFWSLFLLKSYIVENYWREHEDDDSIAKERVLKGGLFPLI